MLVGRLLHHRMVDVWIERRVQGLDPPAVVAIAHVFQLLLNHLEAVQERGRVGVLLRRLDRPFDIV